MAAPSSRPGGPQAAGWASAVCRTRSRRARLRGRTARPATRIALALKLHVELIYDPGCPNVEKARAVLTRALVEVGAPAVWTEWSSDDPACPAHARSLGSPSILVNGKDVAPGPHPWAPRGGAAGPRCRIYLDDGRQLGAPPLSRVVRAVTEALSPDVG
jgi:hypothetical protein